MGSSFSRPELSERLPKPLQDKADGRLLNLLALAPEDLRDRIELEARVASRLPARTALSRVQRGTGDDARLPRHERTEARVPRSYAPSTSGMRIDESGLVRFTVLAQGEVAVSSDRELPGRHLRAGNLHLVEVSRDELVALARSPAVERLELVRPVHLANVDMLADIGHPLPDPTAPPTSDRSTGKNVIIGIVDFGLDFYHSQLRDPATGRTRVLGLLDLAAGAAYTQEQLDRDIASGKPYSVVPHRWDRQAGATGDDAGAIWMRHGTHMACIAAGGHSDLLGSPGVAPDAELLFVSLDPLVDVASRDDLWGGAGMDQVIRGVKWILDRAAAIAKERGLDDIPVVINLSLADYTGPHDGSSPHAAFLDELRNTPGRVLVAAAGNAAGTRNHATLRGGQRVTLAFDQMCDADDAFELWVDADDQATLKLTLQNLQQTERIELTQQGPGQDAMVLVDGVGRPAVTVICNARRKGDSLGFRVDVLLAEGVAIPAGTEWVVELDGAPGAQAQLWLEASNAGLRGWKEASDDQTISDLASHPALLTLGAVHTSFGSGKQPRHARSGIGPTRDGRLKPNVVAPGVALRVAEPEARDVVGPELGQEHASGFAAGTSVATAVASGATAVLMECHGTLGKPALLSARDVRVVLSETADKGPLADSPRPLLGDLGGKADLGAGVIDLAAACGGVPSGADLWIRAHADDDGRIPRSALAAWDSPDIVVTWDDTGADVRVTVHNRGAERSKPARVRLAWSRPISWLHVPGFGRVRAWLPEIFDRVLDPLLDRMDDARLSAPAWSHDGIRAVGAGDELARVPAIAAGGSHTVSFRFDKPASVAGASDVHWLALVQNMAEGVSYDAGAEAPRYANEIGIVAVRDITPGPRGRLRAAGHMHARGPSNALSLRTRGKVALLRVELPGAALQLARGSSADRPRYDGDAATAAADPLVQALVGGATLTGAAVGLDAAITLSVADAAAGTVRLSLPAGTKSLDLGSLRVADGAMMKLDLAAAGGRDGDCVHVIHLSSGDIIGGFSVRQAGSGRR